MQVAKQERLLMRYLLLCLFLGSSLLLTGCFLMPNTPPVAQFQTTPPGGDAPLTIHFDAQSSYDPDGHIVSYTWSFGDGQSGAGTVVSHHYIAPGAYTITLAVEDNRGDVDNSDAVLVVSDPGDFSRHYQWQYGGQTWYWNVSIPKWLYYEYRQRPRGPWGSRDYDEYVLDQLDDDYMRSLGQIIQDAMGGDYYATVECAFNFVQAAIVYVPDPSGFEYPRYPIESLVDEIGDCEDTAILYASLVRTLGYGALISAVDTDGDGKADHMVALVPVHESYLSSVSCGQGCSPSFWEYGGQLYALAETTGDPPGYYLLGCDPWGLGATDFVQIWDVARIDTSPRVKKLILSE